MDILNMIQFLIYQHLVKSIYDQVFVPFEHIESYVFELLILVPIFYMEIRIYILKIHKNMFH
ncbi:hypothetical protein RhiirA5_347464 [Rhizophagus irregularis]|uniref:Uncharacterized protein n=1 Tax=Rhizophagus irregularis TaxID=588596 RepID=A0A2N0QC16_9GLOM|nr:hypothetical protein RhiirA5_347464 [Rhizophagus irregularis]PKC56704.1 hypothetical protein RhiirA1_428951 [Rhizophagus irregularis]PKK74810.1 hypothetical protein RhiirC2_737990 [Rhizophagus irregularis]